MTGRHFLRQKAFPLKTKIKIKIVETHLFGHKTFYLTGNNFLSKGNFSLTMNVSSLQDKMESSSSFNTDEILYNQDICSTGVSTEKIYKD